MEVIQKELNDLFENKVAASRSTPIDVINSSEHYDENDDFRPRVNENLGYVVAAVVFNSFGEVLMIQENQKEKGRGKWYLPAGKVDAGESFEDAVKRIVKLETGMGFTPTTLISMEVCTGRWYRFCFTGNLEGGILKEKKQADKHSVQAKWYPVKYVVHQKGMQLRSHDILLVLNLAMAHRGEVTTHEALMPTTKAHKELLYRVVILYEGEDINKRDVLKVLVSKKEGVYHFPTAEINPHDSWILMGLYRILKDAFGRDDLRTKTRGVLTVEHCGRPVHRNDGICVTSLVTLDEASDPTSSVSDSYEWYDVEDDALRQRLREKSVDGATVALLDIY